MAESLRGQTYRSRHIVIRFTWPRAGISAVGPGFSGVFCEYFFGMMALHGTSVGKSCITASSDLTNLVPTGMYRVFTCMFGSSYSIFRLNNLRLSHFRYALEYGVLLMDLNIDRLALRCFNTVSWHFSTFQTVFSLWLMIMLGTVAFVLGLYKVILDESSYIAITMSWRQILGSSPSLWKNWGSFLAGVWTSCRRVPRRECQTFEVESIHGGPLGRGSDDMCNACHENMFSFQKADLISVSVTHSTFFLITWFTVVWFSLVYCFFEFCSWTNIAQHDDVYISM